MVPTCDIIQTYFWFWSSPSIKNSLMNYKIAVRLNHLAFAVRPLWNLMQDLLGIFIVTPRYEVRSSEVCWGWNIAYAFVEQNKGGGDGRKGLFHKAHLKNLPAIS